MFLAILLSIVVLFGWAAVSERFFPTPAPRAVETVATDGIVTGGQSTAPIADAPRVIRGRAAVLADSPRIAIRTPGLSGTINLKGARIDDLVLMRHSETLAKDSPRIRLFSPSGTQNAYFTEFGWTGSSGLPGADTVWQANASVLTPARPVTLSWINPEGQTFEIEIAVDSDYMFTARQRILNRSNQALVARPYGLIARSGTGPDASTFNAHTGPIGVFGGKTNYDIDYENIVDAPGAQIELRSNGGWLGFTDKYWLSALISASNVAFDANFRSAGGDRYQAGMRGEPVAVGPGKSAETLTRLFAGAKEVDLLDRYQTDLEIPRLGSAIDWGWFEVIAKPIFHLLDWLFDKTGNLGVAIIGLTILIRFVLFPIANKQYASMAKMRAVQPKMKEIQERHKDDKPKQQQAMMELYKTEKVNPMAGCLPILFANPDFLCAVQDIVPGHRHAAPAVCAVDQGSVRARSADAGQSVRPAAVHAAGDDRHRRAADPARYHDVGAAETQSATDGRGAAKGVRFPAMDFHGDHGTVRRRLAAVLDGQQPHLDRPAMGAYQEAPGDERRPVDDGVTSGSIREANRLFTGPIAFLKSAPTNDELPPPGLPEIAFAGRSNVGKSSLLNALTARKALARTSNTPGRTQLLNLFDVGEPPFLRLVDMPGYGYAEAPKTVVEGWKRVVFDYLRGRQSLKRVLLLIDSRRGIGDVDTEVMRMLDTAAVSYQIVLTKADKVKPSWIASRLM